jgi:ABC-type lipoprotein export system ATPase subunit
LALASPRKRSMSWQYFVETDQWKRLLRGEVDIVYGPKGSGKSALLAVGEE